MVLAKALCKESREMILCSGIDMKCACVYKRERESRDTRCIDTENMQEVKYINKGERLNTLQGGRRVLYIVTLSLH